MDEKLMLGIKRVLCSYYGVEKYRAKFPHHAKVDQDTQSELDRILVKKLLTFVENIRDHRIAVNISLEVTPQWRPVPSDSLVDEFFGVDRAKLAKEQAEMVSVFTELLLNQSIGPHNDRG